MTGRNPLTRAAIVVGRQPWLPRLSRYIVGLDRLLQRVTRGRLTLLRIVGIPNLMLQVPGRRTGMLRRTPLLCVPHQDGWLVAGTNWGAPRPPAWVANLDAAGRARVTVRGRTLDVTARWLTGAEREQAWLALNRVWPNYDIYAERVAHTTGRDIRLCLLTPTPRSLTPFTPPR